MSKNDTKKNFDNRNVLRRYLKKETQKSAAMKPESHFHWLKLLMRTIKNINNHSLFAFLVGSIERMGLRISRIDFFISYVSFAALIVLGFLLVLFY